MKALVVAMAIATILLLLPAYSAEYIVKSTETSFLDLRGRGYIVSFAIYNYTLPYTLAFNNNTLEISYGEINVTVIKEITMPYSPPATIEGNGTHEIIGFYFNTSIHEYIKNQYIGMITIYGGNGSVSVREYRPAPENYYYYVYVNGTEVYSIVNQLSINFSIRLLNGVVTVWIDINDTVYTYRLEPPYRVECTGQNGFIYPEITYRVHGILHRFNDKTLLHTVPKPIEYEADVLYIGVEPVWSGGIDYLNSSEPIRVVYAVLEEDPATTTAIVTSSGTGTAGIPWLLLGGLFLIVIVAVLALGGGRKH